ncbi:MAG: ABC transporter substrate-binding protein [Verrucomicrobia bacterium]|nr:ABC transporter substrate-binding protein [Verrucomicrobiota bacterium]
MPIAFPALNLTKQGASTRYALLPPGMAHAPREVRVSDTRWSRGPALAALVVAGLILVHALDCSAKEKWVLRVGHFPNITHAQALIARALAREGKPWFEPRLGEDVTLDWYIYSSGGGAMEAILARTLDLTYVGAAPTLNAYARMKGKDIRIVSGSCSGGAALVVQPRAGIRGDADFRGKTIGTPQLANTQDLAARSWLRSVGHKVTLTGGDVMVIPSANPDLYALFIKKDLDAVWTVEPWVSRLVNEAGGAVYFEESARWPETGGRYATTLLVSSVRLLTQHREALEKFVAAHAALTEWIGLHPQEAQALVNQELAQETKRGMSKEILASSWKRLEFTTDPIQRSVARQAEQMRDLGFDRRQTDLSNLYELGPLNALPVRGPRPPPAP